MVQKRISQLAEGSQAWLKCVTKEGTIHGRVKTQGPVTARASHMHPNLAQVPSVRVPFGKECRELFYAPRNQIFVGADLSGLELRCLAHYMGRFDGGEYTQKLLEGDIHTINQKAAGLETRDQAKKFIYGFLYGAGNGIPRGARHSSGSPSSTCAGSGPEAFLGRVTRTCSGATPHQGHARD